MLPVAGINRWLRRPHRPLVAAFVVFFVAAFVVANLTWRLEQDDLRSLRQHAAFEAANHANALQRSIERALSATYALAIMVQHGRGVFPDFDAVANTMLPLYPGASSLQLAPAGIVQNIVPLAGNEQAIGHNLLQDPTRTKAAFLARDSGKLTLDGPFNLVQGGVGAVGRLPVFLNDAKGKSYFWGFTSVLIRFPEALEVARFIELREQGFAYELWRRHPDTGQKQIIAVSMPAALSDPVEYSLKVPNANWTLSVAPIKGWRDPLRLSVRIALGLLFSLLLGYVAKLFLESKAHGERLETLVTERTHALTLANEDLTRQQQALLESEKQFRGLVEQSLVGIYLSDGGAVHYINPRAEEILGYEPGGLAGQSLTPLVIDEDRPLVVREIRRLVKGEISVVKMDFRMRRKDGSEVTIGTQILRTNVDGRPAIIGVMQDITEKKRAEAEIKRYIAEIETAFMSTVQVTTTLSELRDPYTAGHERRVGEIAVAIGAELGLDAHRQEGLRVAGYLHDIGKISIPTEILCKPGKLSLLEFQLIQNHPQTGYDILKDVKFPWPVAQVALQHHERMDGSGYPQGLKGEAILFEARIVAVADVIEAMSSHRPYRPGLGLEAALAEIKRGRTSAYDPQVVDACLKLFVEKGYTIPA